MDYFINEVEQALITLSEVVEEANISKYSVVGSAPLVLVGLLEWANDIDISIDKNEVPKLLAVLKKKGIIPTCYQESLYNVFRHEDILYHYDKIEDNTGFYSPPQPLIYEEIKVKSRSLKIRPIDFIIIDYERYVKNPIDKWRLERNEYIDRLRTIKERLKFISFNR